MNAFDLACCQERLTSILRAAEAAHRAAIDESNAGTLRRAELDDLRRRCATLFPTLRQSIAAWEAIPESVRIDLAWSIFSAAGIRLSRGIQPDENGAYERLLARMDSLFADLNELSSISETTAKTVVLPTGNPGRSRTTGSAAIPLDGLRAVADVIGPFWQEVTKRRFVKADWDDPHERKHNEAEDFFLAVARLIDKRYTLANCKSVLKNPGR